MTKSAQITRRTENAKEDGGKKNRYMMMQLNKNITRSDRF